MRRIHTNTTDSQKRHARTGSQSIVVCASLIVCLHASLQSVICRQCPRAQMHSSATDRLHTAAASAAAEA